MIKDNILEIRRRVAFACVRVKRSPEDVTIVAASKGRSVGEIQEAAAAGITDIGENKAQEALVKYNQLRASSFELRTMRWHMIGHLQTNKVKEAVRLFSLIQSVDSLRLANEINKQAGKIGKIQDILLEIKTSPEETKFGLKPDEAAEVIEEIAQLKNIRIRGLMTIAPLADNPEKSRPYFRLLRELRDKLNLPSIIHHPSSILSMGMTDDFEVAIEEGANMVRLGRAIFEG